LRPSITLLNLSQFVSGQRDVCRDWRTWRDTPIALVPGTNDQGNRNPVPLIGGDRLLSGQSAASELSEGDSC
jgi:hypothetical protein